jgi:hypothetical protein
MIKRTLGNYEFWAAFAITVVALAFLFLFHPAAMVVTLDPLYHWFSWIGASYIAVTLPLFPILKRRYPTKYQQVVQSHILGNLAAFVLILIHFIYQTGTSLIGGTFTHTGLSLYIALLLLVITGFILRYQLLNKYIKPVRFVHVGLVTAFYLIIVIHVLHGLDVI